MNKSAAVRRGIVLLVVVGVVASGFAGVAAAETRAGGTVVVEAGETVDGLTALGGTVIVRGTVQGNLDGAAGSVVIEPEGVVTGDVSVAAGSFRISGRVDGDVRAGSGSVTLSEAGRIGGDLEAGAGSVLIAGQVDGTVRAGAETVTLAESGRVGGDLRYGSDTTFVDRGGTVGGSIREDPTLAVGGEFGPGVFDVPSVVFAGYAMAVNLLLGAVLLVVVPGFSRRVLDTVATDPLRSAGVGLGALIGVPLALALIAITIIGIPLTLAGAFAFGLSAWIALIYGRIAVADWGLAKFDVDNRWAALVVGVVGFELLGQIPLLGGLLTLATFLLGLGALALSLLAVRQERGGEGVTPEETAPGGDTGAAGT